MINRDYWYFYLLQQRFWSRLLLNGTAGLAPDTAGGMLLLASHRQPSKPLQDLKTIQTSTPTAQTFSIYIQYIYSFIFCWWKKISGKPNWTLWRANFGGPVLHNVTFVGESVTQAENRPILFVSVCVICLKAVCVCFRWVHAEVFWWGIRSGLSGCSLLAAELQYPAAAVWSPRHCQLCKERWDFCFKRTQTVTSSLWYHPVVLERIFPATQIHPKNVFNSVFLMQLQTIFWSYECVSLGSFNKCKLWWRTHRPPII